MDPYKMNFIIRGIAHKMLTYDQTSLADLNRYLKLFGYKVVEVGEEDNDSISSAAIPQNMNLNESLDSDSVPFSC